MFTQTSTEVRSSAVSRRSRSSVAPALALVLALTLIACGSTSKTTASTRRSLTVFAAASLTESFTDVRETLKTDDPGLSIRYSFAGSGALVAQMRQGAPADVIATADISSMTRLTEAGLVEKPAVFARNKLEILVEPGNPKKIEKLADLARGDLKLVLEDDSVPAGKYAAQVLRAAGVTAGPMSEEPDVKSAVAKVTGGEADVTIVYVSDVKAAGSKGQGVEIAAPQNVTAEYPIAVVKASKNRAAAVAFVHAISARTGQDALAEHGFLPAG